MTHASLEIGIVATGQQAASGAALDFALAGEQLACDLLDTLPLKQRRYWRHVNTRGGPWLALAAMRAWARGDLTDTIFHCLLHTLATGSIPSAFGYWAQRNRRCVQRVADKCYHVQTRALHALKQAVSPWLLHATNPSRDEWLAACRWAGEFALRQRDAYGHAILREAVTRKGVKAARRAASAFAC